MALGAGVLSWPRCFHTPSPVGPVVPVGLWFWWLPHPGCTCLWSWAEPPMLEPWSPWNWAGPGWWWQVAVVMPSGPSAWHAQLSDPSAFEVGVRPCHL